MPPDGAMFPTFVSGTTIAAGSAYPAHNRTQTENCVTKPRFYKQKGVSTMKREDVKNKIPGITEEQLNWLMQENGSDITREKNAAAALQAQVTKLKADMQAQADGFAFDSALNTAILGKKGRSVDAVRALLDLDTLKGSKDRTTDINKALEDAVKANPWAFGDTQPAGYPNVKDGGTPNHIPSQPDGVLAAFSKLNPNLKI